MMLVFMLMMNYQNFYKRIDLTDLERKRYKYHLLKSIGEYEHVERHLEDDVKKNTPGDDKMISN
jgi:hypothetical protein